MCLLDVFCHVVYTGRIYFRFFRSENLSAVVVVFHHVSLHLYASNPNPYVTDGIDAWEVHPFKSQNIKILVHFTSKVRTSLLFLTTIVLAFWLAQQKTHVRTTGRPVQSCEERWGGCGASHRRRWARRHSSLPSWALATGTSRGTRGPINIRGTKFLSLSCKPNQATRGGAKGGS